jgi:7-cyano-7-deazaguanine reductase
MHPGTPLPASGRADRLSEDLAMLPDNAPSADQLETFDNQYAGREYTIEIVCPEFTSLCPITGQPDFGTITFTYVPAERCVELKSLKLYLQRYRQQGVFYEHVVNQLLDHFVAACRPVRCRVVGTFTPRGGITTTITCVYEAAGERAPINQT